MLKIHKITFNSFFENTYFVYDDITRECAVIDPGCQFPAEKIILKKFIDDNKLELRHHIITHGHSDHIFGCGYIYDTCKLPVKMHRGEEATILQSIGWNMAMGIPADEFPSENIYIAENDSWKVGQYNFTILFTPGHSVAEISFYCEKEKKLIAGDVLFHTSIGRTDLPGGDFNTLIKSIKEKFFTLPDDVIVYPGHGIETTIGYEKMYNPFLK